jgi:hypothetical protein
MVAACYGVTLRTLTGRAAATTVKGWPPPQLAVGTYYSASWEPRHDGMPELWVAIAATFLEFFRTVRK